MKVGMIKRFFSAVAVAGALVAGIAAPADAKPLRAEKIPTSSPTFIYGISGQ